MRRNQSINQSCHTLMAYKIKPVETYKECVDVVSPHPYYYQRTALFSIMTVISFVWGSVVIISSRYVQCVCPVECIVVKPFRIYCVHIFSGSMNTCYSGFSLPFHSPIQEG